MKLIADSGGTKTDWAFVEDGNIVKRIETQGLNPIHQSEEEMLRIVKEQLIIDNSQFKSPISNLNPQSLNLKSSTSDLHFYGSGCNVDYAPKVVSVLRKAFPQAEIEVESDLLGAAHSLFGKAEGIVCIMGTGSNSCLYDGSAIVENVPPLGYILGDEGSGAVLGKLFLNALFKGGLSKNLRDEYMKETSLTYADIIRKVYREPLANRFLASTSLFMARHIDEPDLRELVKENFRTFVYLNLDRYGRKDLSVGAVGSVAFVYQSLLKEVLIEEGYKVGEVVKSPMEGLVKFHSLC